MHSCNHISPWHFLLYKNMHYNFHNYVSEKNVFLILVCLINQNKDSTIAITTSFRIHFFQFENLNEYK